LMPTAIILVNSDPEVEEEMIEDLIKVEGVKEVHSVYGIYDFVVKVESETLEELKSIITWKVRRLRKVKASTTMIVAQSVTK
jgi:DNA-binding Lrp family transcriptional regulator